MKYLTKFHRKYFLHVFISLNISCEKCEISQEIFPVRFISFPEINGKRFLKYLTKYFLGNFLLTSGEIFPKFSFLLGNFLYFLHFLFPLFLMYVSSGQEIFPRKFPEEIGNGVGNVILGNFLGNISYSFISYFLVENLSQEIKQQEIFPRKFPGNKKNSQDFLATL